MTGTATPSFAAALGLVLLLTQPALAQQERPSLSRIEEAMCAKAGVDGDTYRPFFCPPRCDCLSATNISQVTNCIEGPAGTFTAQQL